MTRAKILNNVQSDTSIDFKVDGTLCTGSGIVARQIHTLKTVNK